MALASYGPLMRRARGHAQGSVVHIKRVHERIAKCKFGDLTSLRWPFFPAIHDSHRAVSGEIRIVKHKIEQSVDRIG